MNLNNATYVENLGVEHVPKSIKKFAKSKNIITNIYKIQEYASVICVNIINFILQVKSLLDYLNLFPPNESENIFNI